MMQLTYTDYTACIYCIKEKAQLMELEVNVCLYTVHFVNY